jgi:hypothetical protein
VSKMKRLLNDFWGGDVGYKDLGEIFWGLEGRDEVWLLQAIGRTCQRRTM